MTTPLVLYATTTVSSVLATANKLAAVAGSGSTNNNATTLCGNTSTGYGQMAAAANAGGWGNAGAGYGAIQAPNGAGFYLEAATLLLAGQQFVLGNWTARIRAKASVGTLSADLYLPVYKFNSVTLAYTLLFTVSLAGQTITTAATNFTFAATSEALAALVANESAYFECWANITANNTGNAAATVAITESTIDGKGSAASVTLTTPGYQLTPIIGGGYPCGGARRGGRNDRRH